jgi:hypothetical protein
MSSGMNEDFQFGNAGNSCTIERHRGRAVGGEPDSHESNCHSLKIRDPKQGRLSQMIEHCQGKGVLRRIRAAGPMALIAEGSTPAICRDLHAAREIKNHDIGSGTASMSVTRVDARVVIRQTKASRPCQRMTDYSQPRQFASLATECHPFASDHNQPGDQTTPDIVHRQFVHRTNRRRLGELQVNRRLNHRQCAHGPWWSGKVIEATPSSIRGVPPAISRSPPRVPLERIRQLRGCNDVTRFGVWSTLNPESYDGSAGDETAGSRARVPWFPDATGVAMGRFSAEL